ncbi:MAG TPA: molybdenum cofactor biosynthesis protein MoaE [Myxococcota bacterium]
MSRAQVDRVIVVDEALSIDGCVERVRHEGAGAVVVMIGMVRNFTKKEGAVVRVTRLEYEAYAAMAVSVIDGHCADIERDFRDARAAVAHRVGDLVPGDLAVVVAVSSPHRAEAFAGCQRLIDRLKHDAPIWKREHDDTGISWVGMGP